MAKYKVKKPEDRWKLDKAVILPMGVVAVMCSLCAGMIGYSFRDTSNDLTIVSFQTDGEFKGFNAFGIEAWLPVDGVAGPIEMKEEPVREEYSYYIRQCAARDGGNYPWEVVGFTVAPEDYGDTLFDLEADLQGFLGAIHQPVLDSVSSAWGGAYPALTQDISLVELIDGRTAVYGSGESYATLVYQDPDGGEPYAKEESAPFKYMATLVDGRPVIAWTLIDYSSDRGEDWCVAAMTDALKSARSYESVIVSGADIISETN